MNLTEVLGHPTRIHVQGEGPPLLLLGGWTRPLESWKSFADALPGLTLISFDAPGVGASPTPTLPLPMSTLAELAGAVMDETGFEQADVLGYSHGGAVAQQLAISCPGRVRRLILVSTLCGAGSVPASLQTLQSLTHRRDSPWPAPDVKGTLWRLLAIASWSSVPFLHAIRSPTLVVCGESDQVAVPANSAHLARSIPGARLIMLPGQDHDLQRGGPARLLAQVVEPFLASA